MFALIFIRDRNILLQKRESIKSCMEVLEYELEG